MYMYGDVFEMQMRKKYYHTLYLCGIEFKLIFFPPRQKYVGFIILKKVKSLYFCFKLEISHLAEFPMKEVYLVKCVIVCLQKKRC